MCVLLYLFLSSYPNFSCLPSHVYPISHLPSFLVSPLIHLPSFLVSPLIHLPSFLVSPLIHLPSHTFPLTPFFAQLFFHFSPLISYLPYPLFSALEARHRQQLKELEDQVKSTWEAKFKVSEEHELARKRLEDEQAAARRQLGTTISYHTKYPHDILC